MFEGWQLMFTFAYSMTKKKKQLKFILKIFTYKLLNYGSKVKSNSKKSWFKKNEREKNVWQHTPVIQLVGDGG